MMGGVDLDLREAMFAAREVVITANAFMGGARDHRQPAHQRGVEGIGIMGGFDQARDKVPAELDANSPDGPGPGRRDLGRRHRRRASRCRARRRKRLGRA